MVKFILPLTEFPKSGCNDNNSKEGEEEEGADAGGSPLTEHGAAATTESVKRIHNENDEPFVIELKPAQSVEKLVVAEIYGQSHSILFGVLRESKIQPIYSAGEEIVQTLEKKFNESLNSGFFKSLYTEFPVKSCCCQSDSSGHCDFCKRHLSVAHIYVSTKGQCQVLPIDEASTKGLTTRAKESSKRIINYASKTIDVFPLFQHTCYESEICEICSNALRLFRWKKEHEKDNILAERMTIVEMYNHLYSQWSLLKYYCEKHLTICNKMKRNRSEKVCMAFEESKTTFRKQLQLVRKESDQMDYYGRCTSNPSLSLLQLEISHFTHRSCSLMQERVSQANEDLKLFLEMERKVMVQKELAEMNLNNNSSTPQLVPIALPLVPQKKKRSPFGSPFCFLGSFFS